MSGPSPHAGEAADDLLRERFTGKRRTARIPVGIGATVQGTRGPVPVTLVDLSRDGALVEVEGAAIGDGAMRAGTTAFLEEVQHQFGDGFLLRFQAEEGRPPVELEAEIVRMTFEGDAFGRLRLGCRFRRAVPREVLTLYGVDDADESSAHRWVPRRGRAPYVLVYGPEGTAGGPRCAARVLSLTDRRLVGRVEGVADPRATSDGLHKGAISLVLLAAGRRLWETPADLLAVRTDGGAALELEVVIPAAPPRKALREFRSA